MVFAAGQTLTANALNNALGVLATNTQLAAGTTTSTAFVSALTGGTACGSSFIAPTSGKVLILVYARLRNNGANISLVSFRIGTGASLDAGTEIVAAADDNVIQHLGTADEGASAHYVASGLTPGVTYNAVTRQRVTAGTGTFASRKLTVAMIPA